MNAELKQRSTEMPLIAILRGVQPEQAVEVGERLLAAGMVIIEVPLNSPRPLASIERLATALEDKALIGAGTVMTVESVQQVQQAGGRLIVCPHFDPAVVEAAKRLELACAPGVATPSEGFAALRAGADALKLFPAEALPAAVVKAWRAVYPSDVSLFPVGGISPETMAPYWKAGANGFGLGSALFSAARPAQEVGVRAERFVAAFKALPAQG